LASLSDLGELTESPVASNFVYQRVNSRMGLGIPLSRGRLLGGGLTSALTHRSGTIVADGRFDVCDGAHEAFVMKEVKDPAQAELGRGTLQSLKG